MGMVDVFAFAVAALAFALSIWIAIPGPVLPLFVVTVAATELWPLFALLNVAALAIASYSRTPARKVAIILSIAALLCTLLPPTAYLIAGQRVPLSALLSTSRPLPAALPADAPVMFEIYGGSWANGFRQKDAALNAVIASWGYRVLPLDYRHAPGARWPAQINDILAQIDAVRAPHVAILGHSSGAQLAVIAAARRPRLEALITYESPVDLDLGYRFPSQPDIINARRVISGLCGGTPQDRPACYRSASPRYAIHTGMPPTLMIVAGRDHVVNVDLEHLLRDEFRSAGVAVTYVELPWADHAFETVTFGFHSRIALWHLRRFLNARFPPAPAGRNPASGLFSQ